MAKSKQMFNAMREQEEQDNTFLDDQYRFNQWMARLEQEENHKSSNAVDVLNNLFEEFGKIYSPKN
jgi:hypothetical protein